MELHYRIIGQGPAVFIFHGLFGMSDNWQSFGRQLADKGYSVILADLRNHGHSGHAAPHNYASMAADIIELIRHTGSENPVLVGHSMGGKAVLKVLGTAPELVGKAIVVDIAPWSYAVLHEEVTSKLLALDLQQVRTRGAAEQQLALSIKDTSTRQFLLKNLFWKEVDQLAWRFNLQLLHDEIGEVGKDVWPAEPVNTPVLFVKGALSAYIDPFRMNEILKSYPAATLVEVPHAGHWVHAEQPAILLEEILQWMG
jgi:pimeloyl-ACP methyl ester carboxylesterase